MADGSYFVILDRTDPANPLWKLVAELGRIPAELDEVGQPLPTEEGRVVLWTATALNAELILRAVPSGRDVYRIHVNGGEQ